MAIAAIGGVVTAGSVDGWYTALNKRASGLLKLPDLAAELKAAMMDATNRVARLA